MGFGFLGFMFWSPALKPTKEEISFDLTTRNAPKRPVPRAPAPKAPRPPSVPVPLELVMTILEAAYADHDPAAYTSLLTSAALVCTAWAPVAQKLLFRHVSLSTQPAYAAFARAVDPATPRGRALADTVVRLTVVLDHKQPAPLSQHAFAHAVSLCPRLYALELSLFGAGAPGRDIVGAPAQSRMKRSVPSFDDTTLAILRAGPRISALRFCNASDNADTLLQLLALWPSLAALDISGTTPRLPSESEGTSVAPCPLQLRELRTNFQREPSVAFMRWLLHGSRGSLRVLECARQPDVALLQYVAREHAATLEALAVPMCWPHEAAAAVGCCAALRELRTESAWATPVLYSDDVLPPRLEHLTVGVGRETPLKAIVAAVKRSRALRAVTVRVWEGGEGNVLLPSLRIACGARGIELREVSDIAVFRRMMDADPVPCATYPRTRSIGNVNYMAACAAAATTPTFATTTKTMTMTTTTTGL